MQEEPIRILHLSDIHFGSDQSLSMKSVFRELVDFICEDAQSGMIPDLVAITGDLVQTGKPEEYKKAFEWLKNNLWKKLAKYSPEGDLPRNRLLLVPGNHDVDRSLVSDDAREKQIELIKKKSPDSVWEFLKKRDESSFMLDRQTAYLKHYNEWLDASDRLIFPWWERKFMIKNQSIHIAGLNSAWMCYGNKDRGKLLLGRDQILDTVFVKRAKSAQWRLAVMHHPWDYFAEFDMNESKRKIHTRCNLVLSGHRHSPEISFTRNPTISGQNCVDFTGGCCYGTFDYANAFHWIELSPQSEEVTIRTRLWNQVKVEWEKSDAETFSLKQDIQHEKPQHSKDVTVKKSRPLIFGSNAIEEPKDFVKHAKSVLAKYNRESDWSSRSKDFVPLQVEVEECHKNRRGRADLMTMLKRYRRKKVFLLTGYPGSGKSVSLRHLCMKKLEKWKSNKPIPLYVNLSEWRVPTEWKEPGKNPPVENSLISFIRRYVIDEYRAETFAKTRLKNLFDEGKVFILLDSFDEIGTVLDVEDKSTLIDKLSYGISSFFKSGKGLQGILASRPFRCPTKSFKEDVHFEILPMSKELVGEFILKRIDPNRFAEDVIKYLFYQRDDLVPAVRNPFYAMLFVEYIKLKRSSDLKLDLPKYKAQFFLEFLKGRLTEILGEDQMGDIFEKCKKIGYYMHKKEPPSLDLPIDEFKDESGLTELQIEDLGPIKEVRLIRIRTGKDAMVSFVHRKFAEYFAAIACYEKKEHNLTSIPDDKRWRDTNVLLCEIVDDQEAQYIAQFYWSRLKKGYFAGENDERYAAIKILQFLRDAYGTRPKACENFAHELGELILDKIKPLEKNDKHDFYMAKLMVELTGVLKFGQLGDILSEVIDKDIELINQTAFQSCRHIPQPVPEILYKLGTKLKSRPLFHYLFKAPEVIKYLEEAFNTLKKLKFYTILLWIEDVCLLLSTMFVSQPLVGHLYDGNYFAGFLLLLPAYLLMNFILVMSRQLRSRRKVTSEKVFLEQRKNLFLPNREEIFSFLFFVVVFCFIVKLIPNFGILLLFHQFGMEYDTALRIWVYYNDNVYPALMVGLNFIPYIAIKLVRDAFSPKPGHIVEKRKKWLEYWKNKLKVNVEKQKKTPEYRNNKEKDLKVEKQKKWLEYWKNKLKDLKKIDGPSVLDFSIKSVRRLFLMAGVAIGIGMVILLAGGIIALIGGIIVLAGELISGIGSVLSDSGSSLWNRYEEVLSPITSFFSIIIIFGIIAGLFFGVIAGIKDYYFSVRKPSMNDQSALKDLRKKYKDPKVREEHEDPSVRKIKYSDIESYLNEFKTSKGKLCFLELLNENVIEVKGTWTDGKLPETGSYEAAILLANMEERWNS